MESEESCLSTRLVGVCAYLCLCVPTHRANKYGCAYRGPTEPCRDIPIPEHALRVELLDLLPYNLAEAAGAKVLSLE